MEQPFERYLLSDNAHCKYARGKPTVIGREFHDYDEAVLFLGGKASFYSKSIRMALSPGTVIFIPREHFHRFDVREVADYRRVILGFRANGTAEELARATLREVKVYEKPSDLLLSVFRGLQSATEAGLSAAEQELCLTTAISQLLLAVRMNAAPPPLPHSAPLGCVEQAIVYMDAHYAEQISLASLAEKLNISPSALSHRFKSALGISVYRYLSEKRISAVRHALYSSTVKLLIIENSASEVLLRYTLYFTASSTPVKPMRKDILLPSTLCSLSASPLGAFKISVMVIPLMYWLEPPTTIFN